MTDAEYRQALRKLPLDELFELIARIEELEAAIKEKAKGLQQG